MAPLLAAALGYLLGSIPTGLILTRLAGLGDIRKIGSGNIGATNVLRTGNKPVAAATLALDILKGAAAVILTASLLPSVPADAGPTSAHVAGIAAFLGHLFPIWLGFKGGKGVATYIGVLIGLVWPVAVVFCAVWLAVAALTRYSSLAALLAALAAPLAAMAWSDTATWISMALLSVLLISKHHDNIRRLLDGEEPKIGRSA